MLPVSPALGSALPSLSTASFSFPVTSIPGGAAGGRFRQPVHSPVRKTSSAAVLCCASIKLRFIKAEFAGSGSNADALWRLKGFAAKFRQIEVVN